MTIEYWTTADAVAGLCEFEQVGDERETVRVPPPEPAVETDDDLDATLPGAVFDREIRAYHRDPAEYKRMNPPALVVKLLATDEDRRLKEQAEKREQRRKADLSKMTTEEIQYEILVKLGLISPLP